MSERKIKNLKLIYDNPQLTGNELYKQSRKQGFGIKKSDFYETLRYVRKLPEPTLEKKEISVPIKYRKPIKDIVKIDDLPLPKKEGSYGIIEIDAIDDKKDQKVFYVKYDTKEILKDQINKIKKKYKAKIIKITFKGFGSYREFIDKKFIKLLSGTGIDI